MTVPDGIDVIESHAIDASGSDVRDVRAVLAGTLAASDGSHTAPIGTHASVATLATIGEAIATDAKALDYTSIAQALNPVYDNGGCLGAVVDIDSVGLSGVDVALVPGTNALATSVTVDDVVVQLHASFKVACIGGSGTITVTASAAHITGDLGVSVASSARSRRRCRARRSCSTTSNLSVSGIPSEVTELFDGIVQSKVQSALQSAIESKVPAIANGKLAGLLAQPLSATVLGEATTLSITPTVATISPTGIYLGVETTTLVDGGSGGMFLTEPTTSAEPLMTQTPDLGVAIANDVLNQLLAGLWAAGAFDKTIPVSSISVLAALLDPDATQLVLTLSLPPTAATDPSGNLQLALGDAIISVQDANGTELQRLALSVQTAIDIAATPAGTITMALDPPTVFAQVLTQTDDGSLALTDTQVQGIVTGAWGVLSGQASTALSKLPMPTIAGIELGNPTINSVRNYVLADLALQ